MSILVLLIHTSSIHFFVHSMHLTQTLSSMVGWTVTICCGKLQPNHKRHAVLTLKGPIGQTTMFSTLPTQGARSDYPPHADNLGPRTPRAILLCWYQLGHSHLRFPLGFFAVGRICQTEESLALCHPNCLPRLPLRLFSGTNLPSQP